MPVPPVQACAGTSWAAHLTSAGGLLMGAGMELIQSKRKGWVWRSINCCFYKPEKQIRSSARWLVSASKVTLSDKERNGSTASRLALRRHCRGMFVLVSLPSSAQEWGCWLQRCLLVVFISFWYLICGIKLPFVEGPLKNFYISSVSSNENPSVWIQVWF